MKISQQILLRIRHRLRARNIKGFGIHSPFLFGLVQQVIRNKHPYYCFANIEAVREGLKNSAEKIYVQDYGTGRSGQRTIASIARTSLASTTKAQMLFRLARYANAKNILELGTSLGVTTAYLAATGSNVTCTTVEGSSELIQWAKSTARKVGLNNIKFMQGNITEILPEVLRQCEPFDFIYFDANHTYQHTMAYFNQCVENVQPNTIFVLDDIHASFEMDKAWREIMQHPKVTTVMQLNTIGIVFFDTAYKKRIYYL